MSRSTQVATPARDATTTLVLYVDADESTAERVAEWLEDRNASLTVATERTGAATLERLRSDPIDCIVSEYDLPDTTGLEFLRAVRETYPNLPVLFFTDREETVVAEAIEAGATDYLEKDHDESCELLYSRVRRAVSHTRSERRARVAREHLQEVFERINGFLAVDAEWTVTYWNERMGARTGRSADEALGASLWEVYPAIAGTVLEERLRHAMAAGEPIEATAYLEASDQWLEVLAYPVEDGLFVQSEDITDEHEQLRELERRNQRLESVARTLSHDLRTPLNVAEGRLELAEETGELGHLEDVAQAHNRMQNLINDLLRLARAEEIEVEPTPLRDVVERSWSFAEADGADLALRVDGDVHVRADGDQLQRIFENLFENACEHGDASTVSVGLLGNQAGFYVEDDGTGLPEEDPGIFISGVSTAADGTGYGLAIAKQIANEHGWQIDAAAAADGGARFEVTGVDFLKGS